MEPPAKASREEVVYRYAAGKAIQELRNGGEIGSALLEHLVTFPLIRYCHAEIGGEDSRWLQEIASSQEREMPLRRFALILLRHLRDHPGVKEFLCGLWKTSGEHEIKLEVVWSLLGYSDLPEELYDDIARSFSSSDRDQWLPSLVAKLGGDEREKVQVRNLLNRYFISEQEPG
ncbi:MAG: hypothetical protein K8I29_05035 [Alphaproteobacteria bacterium]|uniref:Uncharacterized protein n=1 Tax=Candidatus Nitrobium versatile TaxID=2884831 RepID=A0A953LW50_9BACT|nr:hypothetical protein [Candidatus Nitrobium versatile]